MDKISEQIKKVGKSKILVKILYVLAVLIIAKLVFFAGIMVGFHKASFGRAWGEHYNENFGIGRKNLGMMNFGNIGMMDYFPNAHGAIGEIIKMELPNIIVQDKDNTEKVIAINVNTKIQKARTSITINDLKIADFIVTIGTPNEKGVIEAKLIRVISSPQFLK